MPLFPMSKLSKLGWPVLLFLVAINFPITKIWAGADSAKGEVRSGEEIPVGFKSDRYAAVWERNPFTLVTPATPQAHQSPFEKLSLASWFKDGGNEGIFVQNSDTNESQRIVHAPNKDHLRLVALHLNTDPKLVEAVISNGKEQGSVKFRFDAQTTTPVQPAAPAPQISANSEAGQQQLKAVQTASQGPPYAQSFDLPGATAAGTPAPQRIKPGMPRAQLSGGQRAGQGMRGRDGIRLGNPGG